LHRKLVQTSVVILHASTAAAQNHKIKPKESRLVSLSILFYFFGAQQQT
jgi:hypothetical protein